MLLSSTCAQCNSVIAKLSCDLLLLQSLQETLLAQIAKTVDLQFRADEAAQVDACVLSIRSPRV